MVSTVRGRRAAAVFVDGGQVVMGKGQGTDHGFGEKGLRHRPRPSSLPGARVSGPGSHPMVQRPVCYDVAFFDECLRWYDKWAGGLRQGSADLRQRRDDHLGHRRGECARAANARLWERDLAGRTPASHADPGLEAVMVMSAVESSLRCGGETGTEAAQRRAVA
jgi:hypothetical protein